MAIARGAEPRSEAPAQSKVKGTEYTASAEAGIVLPPHWFDDRSTAAIFDGWSTPPVVPTGLDFGTLPASTWLLRVGWRMHGPLDLATIPGGTQVRRAA